MSKFRFFLVKTLAIAFHAMGQEKGAYDDYMQLSLHLAEDFFLQHESSHVQVLIACCIADAFRVFAPEPPYTDPEQVKRILLFLTQQLGGLKDPRDPAVLHNYLSVLLECLANVKTFTLCLALKDGQEIFCQLFELFFQTIRYDGNKLFR